MLKMLGYDQLQEMIDDRKGRWSKRPGKCKRSLCDLFQLSAEEWSYTVDNYLVIGSDYAGGERRSRAFLRAVFTGAGEGLAELADGAGETPQKHYIQADTDAERLLAVSSMDKFPALSETFQDFIRRILDEWTAKEDVAACPCRLTV